MGNKGSKSEDLHSNLVKTSKTKLSENYDIAEKSIGSGKAQIKRATAKKYTKSARASGVAIKLYDGKTELPPDFETEAAILSNCDHPNIVKLFEVSKVGKQMSLILELCTGGSIMDRAPFKEKQASHIIRQLCSAVTYLHKKHIVHRDIELQNILFATPADNSDIKLIDFGCATELDLVPDHPGAFKYLNDKTGSVHIMAPEVIRGRYGAKADMWSVGVCTYMLLNNGDKPFKGKNVDEMERKILQGSINYRGWEHSTEAKQFCQQTIMINSGLRLTATAALRHEWMEKSVASWNLPNELVVSFDLFRMAPPLKRIALNALANKAPASRFRDLFLDLDTTESGTLTRDEFMTGFKHSGSCPEELEDLFTKLDVNCNGEIMYTEFQAATMEAEGELEEAQLQEAFDVLARKTKFITKKSVMKLVGKEKAKDRSKEKGKLKAEVEDIFKTKESYDFEAFAMLFEHGFDASRRMDSIIETSLNQEQLSQLLKEDTAKEHQMKTIGEKD